MASGYGGYPPGQPRPGQPMQQYGQQPSYGGYSGAPPQQQPNYGGYPNAPPPQQQPTSQYGGYPAVPQHPAPSYGGYPNAPPPQQQPTNQYGGYPAVPPQQPTPGYGGYAGAPPPPQQQMPANYYGQQPMQNQPYTSQANYGGPPPPQPGYGQQAPYYGQPMIDPESQAWFMAVDTTGRGRITMQQLREALINPSGGQPFDVRTCNMLIRMFDKNGDGTIDCQEFCALRDFISQWKMQFDRVDNNRSGTIDVNEFSMAMQNLGQSLSPAFAAQAMRTFGAEPYRRTMNFDAFISSCALVHTLARLFAAKQQPPQQQPTGTATFSFEEYIRIVFEHGLN